MKPQIGYTPITVAGEDAYRAPDKHKTMFRWDGKPQRAPKKGEWYMSGAIPAAYYAPNDLSMKFFICTPVAK